MKKRDELSDCTGAAYKEVNDARRMASPAKQTDCPTAALPSLEITGLTKPSPPSWRMKGAPQENLTESLDASGKTNLNLKAVPEQKGAAQLFHRFNTAVQDGQRLDVNMKLQADHAGKVSIELMQPQKPYGHTINEEIDVHAGSQEVKLHGIAPDSPQGLLMSIKLDAKLGGVAIRDVTVKPSSVSPSEAPHYTIKDGKVIEAKSLDTVVKGKDGKNIEMRNGSPFAIGFEVQSLDPEDHSQGQKNIQELLKTDANLATVTPYWNQYQNHPETFHEKIEWLKQHGIDIKEHPAVWDQLIPDKDKNGRPLSVTPQLIKEHAQEIARLPGRFTEINETLDVSQAPKNGVTDWINKETPALATEKAIDWIHSADPSKTIIYNDYQNGDQEKRMLDQLQKDNKLPDAIGIQMHMDQGNWPLSRVEETVNNLAKYGKPVYITEISVLSGEFGESVSKLNHDKIDSMSRDFAVHAVDQNLSASDKSKMDSLRQDADTLLKQTFKDNDLTVFQNMANTAKQIEDPALRAEVQKSIDESKTWASTADGEKRQADYTENLYKVLHSNPHVQGITYWDMTDKNAWKQAPRGWFRADGSPKPVVARMQKLFAQWRQEKPD